MEGCNKKEWCWSCFLRTKILKSTCLNELSMQSLALSEQLYSYGNPWLELFLFSNWHAVSVSVNLRSGGPAFWLLVSSLEINCSQKMNWWLTDDQLMMNWCHPGSQHDWLSHNWPQIMNTTNFISKFWNMSVFLYHCYVYLIFDKKSPKTL